MASGGLRPTSERKVTKCVRAMVISPCYGDDGPYPHPVLQHSCVFHCRWPQHRLNSIPKFRILLALEEGASAQPGFPICGIGVVVLLCCCVAVML